MPATGSRYDPYVNYNFLIEIDNISRGAFQEVSGLESTIEVIEYREGGDTSMTRKLPGRASFGNLTLKRGVTDDVELYEWHKTVRDGGTDRRNGSIVQLDRNREEVARWNFREGWITKLTGPDFKAEGNEIAIETVEIVHEGLERVT
jgi:phage tail-like protein